MSVEGTPVEDREQTSTTQTLGQKRALLVGIRNTAGYPELAGSHQDILKIRELLLDLYGYEPSDITILVDDGTPGHVQPTRDNMLRAMRDLVDGAEPGDHLFFHYCGHSTEIPSRSDEEEDGVDECLVPLDGEDMIIAESELHACLVRPLPAGAHLVAVMDTRHSEFLLDLEHYRCNRVHLPWKSKDRRHHEAIRKPTGPLRHLPLRRTPLISSSPSRRAPRRRGDKVLDTEDWEKRICGDVHSRVDIVRPGLAIFTKNKAKIAHARRSIRNSTPLGVPKAPLARLYSNLTRTRNRLLPTSYAPPPTEKSVLESICWIIAQDEPRSESPQSQVEESAQEEPLIPWSELTLDGARCESPESQFACSGWCYDHPIELDVSNPAVKADVISLASCQDSQRVWEDTDQSMTMLLVDLLRDDPNQSLKEVITRLSHSSYSGALRRHNVAKAFRPYRLVRSIARFERGNRSNASLNICTNRPAFISAPTLPLASKSTIQTKIGEHIAWLKQKLKLSRPPYFDIDDLQNPQLSSARPLDMDRRWMM
ncbi:caspase domain-containing protein [Mycena filopes]|nr:caspase domain-containing protein [Mycena filopes]